MEYLYNGAGPFPDIYSVYTQEMQKTHPYASICEKNGIYYFFADSTQRTVNSSGSTSNTAPEIAYTLTDGNWESGGSGYSLAVIWANHDIYYGGTETIFLAASEPVPVPTYTPNPAAMVNGWLMGQAVRRMRGKQ